MALTTAQKSTIKKNIRKEMAEGTFSIRSFSAKYKMGDTTISRVLSSDKKLMTEYSTYKIEQEKLRQAKTKPNSKATDEPFVDEVAKDFSDKKGVGLVTTKSLNIRTVEDALRIAEVDMTIWEVDRHLINSWEVTIGARNAGGDACETFTNFQVKIWLKRKEQKFLALEELYEKLKNSSPIVPVIKRSMYEDADIAEHNRELEISLADIHLGLRCFAPDSDVDWTPDVCEQMTMEMLDELLSLAKSYGPFERIVFPFGSDYLHSDNIYNTTAKGTHQPEADSFKNNMLRGELLAIAMVEHLKEIAPVKLISVPGNHDFHTSISLSRTLKAYYHNDKNVEVDAGFSPYKFHRYGVNLIGFEHGSTIKNGMRLAGLMANETRQKGWSDTLYNIWHLGHMHRKGAPNPAFMEEQGVGVEYLPSLVPANSWHRKHGFNHQLRGAVAFVWDKNRGPIATLSSFINNYTGKIMK